MKSDDKDMKYGPKSNTKGKKPVNNKFKSKDLEGDKTSKRGIPSRNDWSFYAASDQIAKDVASIPFNYMSGMDLPLNGKTHDKNSDTSTINTPQYGVASIRYVPSIGITSERTDGINMAAVQLYTKIRHVNSGAKNYEAADVMMYVLAMRDIYSAYFQAKRILGTIGLYNFYNHNLPDSILAASGIGASSLRQNIAQYRGRLNMIAKKINSFAVPKYFKAFDRAAYIASYIFNDSDSIRGQMYVFDRSVNYYWDGTSYDTGTCLKAKFDTGLQVTPTTNNMNVVFSNLENQLNALFLDEDALTMSGDILKAFNDAELYKVAETDENYVVSIVHDTDVLSQIENAQFLFGDSFFDSDTNYSTAITFGASSNSANVPNSLDITQANQIIKFTPSIKLSVAGNTTFMLDYRYPINSHKDNPDYRDVLEWTRLATTCSYTIEDPNNPDDTAYQVTKTVQSCGLELPLEMVVVRPARGSAQSFNSFRIVTLFHYRTNAYSTIGGEPELTHLACLSHFDWHPFQMALLRDPSQSETKYNIHLIGDIKVVTTVERETLDKINKSACYGAFYNDALYR